MESVAGRRCGTAWRSLAAVFVVLGIGAGGAAPAIAGVASATKTAALGPGNTVTYDITLTPDALGQLDNPGNELVDVLQPGLTLTGASATSGIPVANLGTNTVTWNGALSGPETITITAQASCPPSGVIVNQAQIAHDADGNGTNESSLLSDDPAQAGTQDPTPTCFPGAPPTPTPPAPESGPVCGAGQALVDIPGRGPTCLNQTPGFSFALGGGPPIADRGTSTAADEVFCPGRQVPDLDAAGNPIVDENGFTVCHRVET